MGQETLRIVALRRVAYSDRHAIVTAWSRQRGRVSLLVPEGAGRGAARLRALTMPPALLEAVVDVRPGRDIWPARGMRPLSPLVSLRTNPLKSLVGQLVAEILADVLRQSSPDPLLSDYIELSLATLDALDDSVAIANFHLVFLRGLLRFTGIEPDLSTYRPGSVFDMREGLFRSTMPPHTDWLDARESAAVLTLGRITTGNMHRFRYTKKERNRALDLLLHYMSLHHQLAAPPKSLEVIRSLF